jgi:hypothetical protein
LKSQSEREKMGWAGPKKEKRKIEKKDQLGLDPLTKPVDS